MQRPFYIIAHRVNDTVSISRVITEGANAIECDVRHVDGRFIVSHNWPDLNPVDLEAYLQSIAATARNNNRLALVIFDCKENSPTLAVPFLEAIRNHLTNQISLNVLISIASYDDRQFLASLAGQLSAREAVAIDQDDDPARVSGFFQGLRIQNHAYGNGIAAVLWENPFAPNVPPSIMEAIAHKALRRGIRFVYVWTLDDKGSMRDYLRMGVDGIMTNDVNDLVEVIGESEFQAKVKFAARSHKPFDQSTLPAYVLTLRTGIRGSAGTDSNLRFNLVGERGTISTRINAKPTGLFEQGQTNRVTLIGEDVGTLQKLTISRDSAGNAPGWFLWDVVIQSADSPHRDRQLGKLNFHQWIEPQEATRWFANRDDLLKALVSSYKFGVTDPLTHDEVKELAHEWMPEIRFHEEENFHCISLGEFLKFRNGPGSRPYGDLLVITDHPRFTRGDPSPVFFQSHDWKSSVDPGAPEVTTRSYVSNISELYHIPSRDPTNRDWSPYGRALEYFGSKDNNNGVQLPRVTPMTTIAEYRDLRQTLFFNVQAQIDAMDGKFPADDTGELLDAIQGPPLFVLVKDKGKRRKHLRQLHDLIKEVDSSNQPWLTATSREKAILGELIADGVITESEWRVMRDFAFLEYYLVYAYNDISKQHPNLLAKIFGGDHEGDIEGFAVVFDRREVAQIEQVANRDRFLKTQLKPHFLVNSAHEPWQGWDRYRMLFGTRDQVKNGLKVWVMAGSHATVLKPGSYDNLEGVDQTIVGGGIIAAVAGAPAYAVPVAILMLLIEHFVSPDEETSDNGVHAISPSQPLLAGDPIRIRSKVLTTPLSRDRNIYQDLWQPDRTEIDVTLAERSFPGAWGFDGPRWINKTWRFIRRLAEHFEA
jgi:glycerophosphoryl diester phosphodiesterase